MIVVADTSPLNYLVLIHQVEVIPRLFGEILVPPAVVAELMQSQSGSSVALWISSPPAWLKIQAPRSIDASLDLDIGEREAIALAEDVSADTLLVDDQKARRAAIARGFAVIGTLGIIKLAAIQGLLDAHLSLGSLRQTNFYLDENVVQAVFGKLPDAR